MNLEFYPHRQTCGRGQSGETHSFRRVACAARIRENKEQFRIDEIENVRERVASSGEIGATECDRNDLRSTRGQRVAHGFV